MVTASISGSFSNEPYWNEKPSPDHPNPVWGGSGGGGSGGGSGGGGGGGGGAVWVTDDPSGVDGPIWQEPTENVSAPYLRTGSNLYLFSCGAHLLRGTSRCPMIPILGQIGGKDSALHCRCLLFRTTGKIIWKTIASAGDFQFGGRFDWTVPQEMKIELKWQSGHYDIAEICRVRLVIFGIDLGWVTLAQKDDYTELALIRIDGTGVFVNSLKADFAGNLKYIAR